MTNLRALSINDFLPAYHAFRDRVDAGERLAAGLDAYRGKDVLVLGIPRGGVPVAAEVARRLEAELDVIVARKLGAPYERELAIGAVTADGGRFLNSDVIQELEISDAYLQEVTRTEMEEAQRRQQRFRGDRPPPRVAGRVVILVDDGLATGATMRAAVRAVRLQGPQRLVVAVPVGSWTACAALRGEADEVVTLLEPELFLAVGLYYQQFAPTEDTEVQALLAAAHATSPATPA